MKTKLSSSTEQPQTRTPPSTADHNVAAAIPSSSEILKWSLCFGLLTILLRIPFIIRYDLFFQSSLAVEYLKTKRMLLGEWTIYTWGNDYGGIGPADLLANILYLIVGPSIAVGALASLIAWSTGIGVLVGYVAWCYGKRAAILAGSVLAIGSPGLLLYSTQQLGAGYSSLPLYLGVFLWLTVIAVRKGPTLWLAILIGFLMGWLWYVEKRVLTVWLPLGVGLVCLPQGRDFLKRFLRSKAVLVASLAFLVGYSPELAYRYTAVGRDRGERAPASQKFFAVATPQLMTRNWYMLLRCIPQYFDADPWSRSDEQGFHYLNHMENWESFPLNASDTAGVIAAFLVIGFGLQSTYRAYQKKNLQNFLLDIIPIVNVFLIVLAAQSGGAYYSIRRYTLIAGLVFMVWWGVRLAQDWTLRRWGVCFVLGLTLAISAFHQAQLLQTTDKMADFRAAVADIERSGYQYGLAGFSYAHTLTALSNERVKFGIVDFCFQNPYQTPALAAETVAVVWPAVQAPPLEFAQMLFFGHLQFPARTGQVLPERLQLLNSQYERAAPPHVIGELGWAPYRRLVTTTPTAKP